MQLETTPFSNQELKKKYKITTFVELGVKINMLNDVSGNRQKLSSGNCYKFGVIIDGNYFWYFNGEPVRKIQGQTIDRAKMRNIYGILLDVNKNTTNIPFTFKVKK
jgi:hypothetical protein